MSSAFLDYFRCPEDLVGFSTASEVSETEGFFAFDGTVCYGRPSVRPSSSVAKAPDVSSDLVCRDGRLVLPFDLSEVVSNLRQERYVKSSGNGTDLMRTGLVRDVYYHLRPSLPVWARRHLQKIALSGWEKIAFPSWPVDTSVDQLMRRVLAEVLKRRGGRALPFIWFWPQGAPSCAIVTHDVEHQAGREFCGAVMDLDAQFGVRSAFQIVPEERYDGALALADTVRSRGFEVNVHDLNHDGNLFRDRRQFLSRAGRINQHVHRFGSRGFRSGAMYRRQDWYDAFEFAFDMSVPNVAHLEPQRGGCCTVMPYFVGNVLELPLTTVQDYLLLHILGDYSTALWQEQMRRIVEEHGLISFVTHPDYLIADRARAVYRDLLEHLSRQRDDGCLWMTAPSEVDRWWRDRRDMKLVPTGTSWRVEGPSSERAVVAYAVLENGRCVYRFEPPSLEESLPWATENQLPGTASQG